MPAFLRPHSPEWFEAIYISRPDEAAHTSWILRIAGLDAACGNCGSRFAADVRLVDDADLPRRRGYAPPLRDMHQAEGGRR